MRKPNMKDCIYGGYKLSNIDCDDIETTEGYVSIGSDSDDTKNVVNERATITILYEPGNYEDGYCNHIDLEDVLRFAACNCSVMYDRVREEMKPYKEQA